MTNNKTKLKKRVPIFAIIGSFVLITSALVIVPIAIFYKISYKTQWNAFAHDFKAALPELDNRIIKENPGSKLTNSDLHSTANYKIIYQDSFNTKDEMVLVVDFSENFNKGEKFNIKNVKIEQSAHPIKQFGYNSIYYKSISK